MAITSANPESRFPRYSNNQFLYAVVYVLITFLVLLFLNLYCSQVSERLIRQSKQSAILEKAQLTARDIGQLEVLNPSTAQNAVSAMSSNHIMITDNTGLCIYDSQNQHTGKLLLLPEIVSALQNNDTFTLQFVSSGVESHAAVPIYIQGAISGAVYLSENDPQLGFLAFALQKNILVITVILEALVILFSLIFSRSVSRRVNKLMSSLRQIQKGDYTQKLNISGNDELSFLGNEINVLTERLQTSEQKRNQFVSDASHELKTPLASIKLLSDSILQNNMEGEIMMEFVQDIGNEAERLNRMSQKLLTLAKVDAETAVDSEIINVAPTISRVAKMLSVIAKENSIHILEDIRQDATVLISEDDLYQVIFNLAENGIKYNTPGGTLTLTLDRDDDNVILSVSDTGMGIPPESIPHIFERFYRVDKARSRKSGGSGLGLAIVRNIVERNRGEMRVESTVGMGTTFTVTFPVFDI